MCVCVCVGVCQRERERVPDNGEMLVLGFNVNCCLFLVCLGFCFCFVCHHDCSYLWLPEEGDCLTGYVVVVVGFFFGLLVGLLFVFWERGLLLFSCCLFFFV